MKDSVRGVGVKLARGVDTFLEKGARAATSKALPPVATTILASTSFGAPETKAEKYSGTKLQQLYQQRAAELQRSAADPMAARARINESLMGVRLTDPSMADQLADLSFKRLQALLDAMPKSPYPASPFVKSKWLPPDSEIAKWARVIQVAEDPSAVMDHMVKGTLTPEHVETLKALYPQIYKEIQFDIVSRAAELQTSLPWEKRVTLSTLFEAPIDDILRPESVFKLQETFTPEQGTEPKQAPAPSSSNANRPTKAQELAG
jgi:hypothetical protein